MKQPIQFGWGCIKSVCIHQQSILTLRLKQKQQVRDSKNIFKRQQQPRSDIQNKVSKRSLKKRSSNSLKSDIQVFKKQLNASYNKKNHYFNNHANKFYPNTYEREIIDKIKGSQKNPCINRNPVSFQKNMKLKQTRSRILDQRAFHRLQANNFGFNNVHHNNPINSSIIQNNNQKILSNKDLQNKIATNSEKQFIKKESIEQLNQPPKLVMKLTSSDYQMENNLSSQGSQVIGKDFDHHKYDLYQRDDFFHAQQTASGSTNTKLSTFFFNKGLMGSSTMKNSPSFGKSNTLNSFKNF